MWTCAEYVLYTNKWVLIVYQYVDVYRMSACGSVCGRVQQSMCCISRSGCG